MLAFRNLFATALLVAATVQFVAASALYNDPDDCPQICPALYAPLCATDGAVYKQFNNKCELKVSNCRQRERKLQQIFAQTAMEWCTSEYLEDIFSRLNYLDLEVTDCNKPCPMIYLPVCVSDGKYRGTISNQCLLDTMNCALKHHNVTAKIFKTLKHGEC